MLSEREKDYLRLARYSTKQIAGILFLSEKTINPKYSKLYDKYKFPKGKEHRNRAALLDAAIKAGDIKEVDLGFWNNKGEYIPDIQTVDFRKE